MRLAAEAAEVGAWELHVVTGEWTGPIARAMLGISSDAPVDLKDFQAGLHPDVRDATAATLDPSIRAAYDVE